jgi:hypothetical protein
MLNSSESGQASRSDSNMKVTAILRKPDFHPQVAPNARMSQI